MTTKISIEAKSKFLSFVCAKSPCDICPVRDICVTSKLEKTANQIEKRFEIVFNDRDYLNYLGIGIYNCELTRTETRSKFTLVEPLVTEKTDAALMGEIAAAVAEEIERYGLNEGEIDELKVTGTREGYFLVHANGAQDRIFAKVVKA